MEQWLAGQYHRLTERPRRLPQQRPADADSPPIDPWEAAIAQARTEIRDLIESGDIDHAELFEPWLEQGAADIFTDQPEDRCTGRGSGRERTRLPDRVRVDSAGVTL